MSNVYNYNVVIVGAGISGALIANELAKKGKRVAILEAGPKIKDRQNDIDRFYAAAAKVPASPWPHTPAAKSPSVLDIGTWKDPSNYMVQRGTIPFASTYERIGGGTTNHWLGTCLRFLPNDFKLNSYYGVTQAMDWPLTYADLEPWYCKAEKEIGVSGDSTAWNGYLGAFRSQPYPMEPIPQSYVDQQFTAGLAEKPPINGKTLQVMSTPQGRNSIGYDNRPPCMGNTSCVPICPIRAKYDAGVTLEKAMNPTTAGAVPTTVIYQAVAYQVMVDPVTNLISGIRYKRWEGNGTAPTTVTDIQVTARIYVLCAHAIETAKLLLLSPWGNNTVANSSGQVGKNLMDHICQVSWAYMPNPCYPFRGPLSTSGIGNFRDGDERKQHAAYRIEIGNAGWNWPVSAPFSTVYDLVQTGAWGAALQTQLRDQLTKQVRMAAELESITCPTSYVAVDPMYKDVLGIPRPVIHYDLTDYTKRGYAKSADTLSKIYKALGADEKTAVDPKSPAVLEWDGKTYQYRGAGHIMGTYRMGDQPNTSVTNGEGKTHDHDNLFLAGSGLFPTTGTANPTLTIMALALRSAATIEAQL